MMKKWDVTWWQIKKCNISTFFSVKDAFYANIIVMLGNTRLTRTTRAEACFLGLVSLRIAIIKLGRRYSVVMWLWNTRKKTVDWISHVAKHWCGIIPARNREYRCEYRCALNPGIYARSFVSRKRKKKRREKISGSKNREN